MQNIFISGGASGLGLSTAKKFLAEGWRVGVYDLVDCDLQHENLVVGRLDVTQPDSWEAALADFTAVTGGQLDILDNNAGVIRDGSVADLKPADISLQVQVNAYGVTLGARAAYPYLKKTPGSHLVSMASASGIYGQPEIATYSATKAYVGAMTEALGLEWRKDDIRVIDIWPLWAKTSLAETSATSARRLGVHITPEQVAERIWVATHPKNAWQRGRIHYGVSPLDEVLYRARHMAPDRVARIINKALSAG
ncbi:SDR family oxidoreductase [Corynebacterium sp. 3HC-13]|uniref:SDR family oxidoreductase n=1 Tax=Corynebacterium poyangense TaxID=2684405 RepID=UPI001CCBC566|nr:SDR family oxidoreductase [Corynebacterium poyangense]MBZ8177481.1 SDR family oxidoreductase [Corynebacterium poyangense]